jgi:hypothetical protein
MSRHRGIQRREHQPEQHRVQPVKVQDPANHPAAKLRRPVSAAIKGQKPGLWAVQFFRRHPLLMLAIVWLTFVSMAGLAVLSIVSLDDAQPPQRSARTIPEAPPPSVLPSVSSSEPGSNPVSQQPSQSLPLFSVVAILLSCGTGCVFALNLLKPRPATKRTPRFLGSRPASQSSAQQTGAKKLLRENQFRASQQTPQSSEASVNIVPTDVIHPLDWEEPSLADSLDLRQKRPLSYWL